jgi:hypothetical protein
MIPGGVRAARLCFGFGSTRATYTNHFLLVFIGNFARGLAPGRFHSNFFAGKREFMEKIVENAQRDFSIISCRMLCFFGEEYSTVIQS